jgi:carbon-monoxide dehydrogenase small subunit
MTEISFTLNDETVTVKADPTKRLLDILRNDFHLLGSKEGCGEGECGACAVLLNGKIVNSCLVPLGSVDQQEIVTIEGLSKTKRGEILKESFASEGAVQCGFCTPGMIIASESLLKEKPNPSEKDIKEGLSGNLCRCTGYNMIVSAVNKASKDGEGLW